MSGAAAKRSWLKRATAADGFTLIEMIVALAILSISLGVLLAAFSQDMDRQRLNRSQMAARLQAQALLDGTLSGDALKPGTTRGVAPGELSWTLAVARYTEAGDPKAMRLEPAVVTATVEWPLDGVTHRVSLTTLRFLPAEDRQ